MDVLKDLTDEQESLEQLLRTLSRDQWLLPTPAEGWDVRDTVSHLADTEEIAYDTATGGPRQLNEEALRFSKPEDYTQWMVDKGRSMEPETVLAWWVDAAAKTRAMFRTRDPKERVPWGLGMSVRSLVTARLMEHWAHGLDIRAAVGEPPNITPRCRSVAWLIVQALPYAFSIAKREPPPGTLRVELDAPGGETWTFGPDEADNRITGDAGEFCRVGVQRMSRADATTLKADGPLADAFLDVARAFL